jgi:tRNA (adenine57-N1/adenine58-N1)-methyltransferase catalytic subunit
MGDNSSGKDFYQVSFLLCLSMTIKEGNYVLLFHTSRKKWLMRVNGDKKVHTHLGVIDVSSIIGKEYGMVIRTSEGKIVHLVEPTIHDFIMKSERKTQIIYPKDLGFIAARTGLQNGSKVLEIGTGSAALSTFVASIVKPTGHVYTYDINPEFVEIARKNLEKASVADYVTTYIQDPHLGIDTKDVDAAIVDLGDPWSMVGLIYNALKPSGAFVAICPTMNQLERCATELRHNGFIDIDCVELMIRNIEAREGMSRPSMRMIGHTTYLIFARKASLT